jgi:hypothetical protein
MTVASCVESEKELGQVEAHHLCPEKVLAQLLAQERALEARVARN